MSLKTLLEKIDRYFKIREINKFLKRDMPSIAWNIAYENNLKDRKIQIYEDYYLKRQVNILKIREDIRKERHDLTKNNSEYISKEVFLEPEFKNDLFKELYNAKESGDFKKISYLLKEDNFIKVNYTFTYLYEDIYQN